MLDWSFPVGSLELHFDGCPFWNPRLSGTGAVHRDHSGRLVRFFPDLLGYAGLLALLEGLLQARPLGIDYLQVKGPSSTVISCIQRRSEAMEVCHGYIKSLILVEVLVPLILGFLVWYTRQQGSWLNKVPCISSSGILCNLNLWSLSSLFVGYCSVYSFCWIFKCLSVMVHLSFANFEVVVSVFI